MENYNRKMADIENMVSGVLHTITGDATHKLFELQCELVSDHKLRPDQRIQFVLALEKAQNRVLRTMHTIMRDFDQNEALK